LWRNATQTVFGEGLKRSRIMMVGEMPGDREDRLGRPFVGPAGRELDRGLKRAGIDRRAVYLTNVVKHFKFEERGKRRIHKTPDRAEVRACRPWFDAELAQITPELLVILGAIAARELLGSKFTLRAHRGQLVDSDLAPLVTATIHPSAILRAPDDASRQADRRAFAEDLEIAVRALTARAS
jgi:DNA polymerase